MTLKTGNVNIDWLHDEANSPFIMERCHAAASPHTPKEDLARLLSDPDESVRRLAIANPAARNLTPA